jgi:hypothetical protein
MTVQYYAFTACSYLRLAQKLEDHGQDNTFIHLEMLQPHYTLSGCVSEDQLVVRDTYRLKWAAIAHSSAG